MEPDIFERYVEWLYRHELSIESSYSGMGRVHALAKLFILGERLQDTPFRNDIMDKFCVYASGPGKFHSDAALISLVFDNLPESSPLRRFLIDMEVFYPTPALTDSVKSGQHQVPMDYMCDLLERSRTGQRTPVVPWLDKRVYHEQPRPLGWQRSVLPTKESERSVDLVVSGAQVLAKKALPPWASG